MEAETETREQLLDELAAMRQRVAELETIAREKAWLLEQAQENLAQRQRAEEEHRKRERFLALLNEITRAALETSDLSTMLQTVADRLGELFTADGCLVTLWDEATQISIPTAAYGEWREVYQALRIQAGEATLTASVLRAGHPMVVDDVFDTSYLSRRLAGMTPARSLLGLPLIAAGRKLGAALIAFNEPHQFTQDDIARGEQAAGQIALAMARALLLEETRKRWREAETLRQAGAALTETLSLAETLDRILEQLGQVMPYDSASVLLLREGYTEIVGGRGFSDPAAVIGLRFPVPGDNPNTLVIERREPVILSDAPAGHTPFREAPHDHIRSWMGVPLLMGDRVIGLFGVDSVESGHFNQEHARLVVPFANQAAVAIENARLYTEAERRVAELATLTDVGKALSSALRVDEVVQLIYQQTRRVMYAEDMLISLYDPLRHELECVFSTNPDDIPVGERGLADVGLVSYIVGQRRSLLIRDKPNARARELGLQAIGQSANSWLGVPMLIGDRLLGTIIVQHYAIPNVYDESHQLLLETIASQAAVAIENARLFEQAQHEIAERKRAEEELRQVNEERASRNRELALLNRIITATTSRLEPKAVLEAVCRELALAFDLTQAAAALFPRGGTRSALEVMAEYRTADRPSALGGVIPVEHNPATLYVLQRREPLAVADAQHDPRMASVHELMRQRGVASLLILPLTIRGQVVGTIGLDALERRQFTEEEITLAANAAAAASQALENAQAEEALRQARDAAEAANQAKSAFLANMSHELRTPLNAILGFTRLTSRDPNLTTEQRENLEIINRSGEHLLALINDVLNMSKIEAGRVALAEEGFNLYLMLEGLEEMFRLRAEEKRLRLSFERAEEVPQYVRTDEAKLCQVLSNLLGNAVKFTETGGVTLRVSMSAGEHTDGFSLPPRTSLDRPGDQPGQATALLVFEVEDTGPGIAPEYQATVFDPFVQAASEWRSQEGTGLGLSISRQYVRLMGGDLTVSSEVGRGCLFKFEVQVALVDAAEVQAARPARRVLGLEPDQPIYRLLVAEDDETNRRLLVSLLELLGPSTGSPAAGQGFEVRGAANGQEAIEIWRRWKPHLIWMDMRMPVVDGYEATKYIKSEIANRKSEIQTSIIALTASAFEEDQERILAEGCDGFVRKPFREDEIYDMLVKHLGVRFVYEEVGAPPAGVQPAEAAVPLADALTRQALAALPAGWVSDLQEATVKADLSMILTLIDQISNKEPALADALADLARNFEYRQLLTWIEQAGR